MFNAEISAQGLTIEDIEIAVEEAIRRIKAGNVAGMDENETGSFHFEINETED